MEQREKITEIIAKIFELSGQKVIFKERDCEMRYVDVVVGEKEVYSPTVHTNHKG